MQNALNPPYDDGCNCDCGDEDVCPPVIWRCSAAAVVEPSEPVLNLMALFVLNFAEGSGCLSSSSWRNAWGDPPGLQRRAIIVSIVSLVCDHDSFGALTDNRMQEPRTDMIRHLASRQAHGQRSSVAIADGMAFGVQSAFCAPDVAGNTLFQKARRGAMSLHVCCIDHQPIGWPSEAVK